MASEAGFARGPRETHGRILVRAKGSGILGGEIARMDGAAFFRDEGAKKSFRVFGVFRGQK